MPSRPGKHALSQVICCLAALIGLFIHINKNQQCAHSGVESFMCLLFIGYEIFSQRRRWGVPHSAAANDPWRSFFDDLYDWFTGTRVTLVLMITSAFMFTVGTYLSSGNAVRSTFTCFAPFRSTDAVLLFQIVGLLLDASVVIQLWRILSWTRTPQQRLFILGISLTLSVLLYGLLLFGSIFLGRARSSQIPFGTLEGFDLLVDSIALATMMISGAFWICETSLITPASVITSINGAWNASKDVLSLGSWMGTARIGSLTNIWLIGAGTILFAYTHDIKSILFIKRSIIRFIVLILLIAVTVFALTRRLERFDKRHPISDFMYRAQIRQRHWTLDANTSKTLATAVRVYEERHSGMAPPPYFDQWYQIASTTPVIDEFKQIDRDIRPFRSVSPAELRQRAALMAAQPDTAVIKIKAGEVTRNEVSDAGDGSDLDELVSMIKAFSQYLPDMTLPINLDRSPRVLPPWTKATGKDDQADMKHLAGLISRRSVGSLDDDTATRSRKNSSLNPILSDTEKVAGSARGQMRKDACPRGSLVRAQPHWNFSQFCLHCAQPHSQGQFMSSLNVSLEVCEQPDLTYMHSFYMSRPDRPLIRQLTPLFGPSKTDEFCDVIIPLPRSRLEKVDSPWQFSRRYDYLFWRGSLRDHEGDAAISQGNHKFRLMRLLRRSSSQDQLSMLLPTQGQAGSFSRVRMSAAQANDALPFSVGLDGFFNCVDEKCRTIKEIFRMETDGEEPLEYRYVLLLDEDNGPSTEVLRTLKSGSVPFVSTIFRTWYTERLQPWLHFVPIDLRFQALHATLSYFTGMQAPTKRNEITTMQSQERDAQWIARQGQMWAKEALGKKDMEVYLFRLLLEWARLLDPQRDVIGFRMGPSGNFVSDEWTLPDDGG